MNGQPFVWLAAVRLHQPAWLDGPVPHLQPIPSRTRPAPARAAPFTSRGSARRSHSSPRSRPPSCPLRRRLCSSFTYAPCPMTLQLVRLMVITPRARCSDPAPVPPARLQRMMNCSRSHCLETKRCSGRSCLHHSFPSPNPSPPRPPCGGASRLAGLSRRPSRTQPAALSSGVEQRRCQAHPASSACQC